MKILQTLEGGLHLLFIMDGCDGMGAVTQGYSLNKKCPYQKCSYVEGLFLGK